jgi:two-component system, NtrC family, response regulator
VLLIIDDDIAIRTSLSLLLKKEGFAVSTQDSPENAIAFIEQNEVELILLDMNFSNETTGEDGLVLLQKIKHNDPTIPIILITGWATIDLAVKGMKLGANDFIHKPWQNAHLVASIRTILSVDGRGFGAKGEGLRVMGKESRLSRKQLDLQYDFSNIVGENQALLQLLETVGRVAATDASVLIMGESGTGKELIAEALHLNSLRAKRPFVKVNLGGISSTLFESEMFGHIRGAFTDAKFDRTGRFELANRGTIFLDEIGELEMSSQVKLLRVLQDRTFEPLGSSRSKMLDVRVVCATNKNLEEMVANGTFREDLFYRINLITITLPSLHQRADDIPLLVNFFVNNLREIYHRPYLQVSKEALRWLKNLSLQGNIRQLKNLVERTILVSSGDMLEVSHFQQNFNIKPSANPKLPEIGSFTLEEMEVLMIKQAMEFHKGKVIKVAKSLGLTRSALYRRLEKFNIPFEEGN